MSADFAHELQAEGERAHTETRSWRVRLVLGLGPLTSVAGVGWALVQPWRLTLLHPTGQGFWWLFAEPQVFVVLVGVLFRWLLAPGIVEDLEASE